MTPLTEQILTGDVVMVAISARRIQLKALAKLGEACHRWRGEYRD